MPVEQQFCKLPSEIFQLCYKDSLNLGSLINYTLLPESNYLNLGWNGSFLERLLKSHDPLYEEYSDLLRGRLGFSFTVDVTEQPRHINPTQIKIAFDRISKINIESLLLELPNNLSGINSFLKSDFEIDPRESLAISWSMLMRFYDSALINNNFVITWWD